MSESGTDSDGLEKDRLLLVQTYKRKGLKTGKAIADAIEGDLGIQIGERQVQRYMKTLREESRYILDDAINGEFIVEFNEALDVLKAIRDRCETEIVTAEQRHKQRETEIRLMMGKIEMPKQAHIMSTFFGHLISIDSQLATNKLNCNRTVETTTKDFLSIYGKTNMVWALDEWIKKNSPKPLEAKVMKALELPEPQKEEDDK